MSAYSDDKLLLDDLREGKASAYEHMYSAYFNMVKFLILKNSGTEDDANDIFQEAIVAFFEKVQNPEFEIKAAVKTYLYSMCRFMWLKKIRDTKPTSDIQDFENYIEIEEDDDKELTERQLTILEKCLDMMGDPCRALLTRFYYLKKSMEEIADEMGYTNAGNAKNQKYRCLKRLRKLALENS